MDPALQELIENTAEGQEVAVILKLRDARSAPAGVRVVSQFEQIVTCRIPRELLHEVWGSERVESVKAPRFLNDETVPGFPETDAAAEFWDDSEYRIRRDLTGRGCAVAVLDWGCDFAHPNFLNEDGSTRLLALWDQSGRTDTVPDNRWGYGIVHTREAINQALREDDPYAALGYHPARSDKLGVGTHGTSVMDIAAGSGRQSGSPLGVAPEAELIFVHLASGGISGLADLGDSVNLLEALDFATTTAGDRPLTVNMSLGRTAGSHTGDSLVEQGMDAMLISASGRAIVQSAGNYFTMETHTKGRLPPAGTRQLAWIVDPQDVTPNELEIWYSGSDRFQVSIQPPDCDQSFSAEIDERAVIYANGEEVGRLYHRSHDPTNGDNHIDIFLDEDAPHGEWQVTLFGEDVTDGRFHAWIERDAGTKNQSRFHHDYVRSTSTIGTIANGYRTVVVGAFNPASSERESSFFSSSGPTRDGRSKPDILAPGQHIWTARSTAKGAEPGTATPVAKMGTSFAAPHVTGAVTLMFQAVAPHRLSIAETRALLLGNTVEAHHQDPRRAGNGYLNIDRTLEVVRKLIPAEANSTDAESPKVGEEIVTLEQNNQPTANMNLITQESAMDQEIEESDAVELDNATESIETVDLDDTVDADAIDDADYAEITDYPETLPEYSVYDAASLDYEAYDIDEYETESACQDDWQEDFPSDTEAAASNLVEYAEAILASGRAPGSSDELLSRLLAETGIPNIQTYASQHFAADIYDALMFNTNRNLKSEVESVFDVYLPSTVVEECPIGSLIIRRALGEGKLAYVGVVASDLYSQEELSNMGSIVEGNRSGWYAKVIENTPQRVGIRRLLDDSTRRLMKDQIVLYLRTWPAQSFESYPLLTTQSTETSTRYYPNDPNLYQNPVVRRALHELNRIGFDVNVVLDEMRRADVTTLNQARITLEKVWDAQHADKWLALTAGIRRRGGTTAHQEVLRLADNALRRTLTTALSHVPRDRLARVNATLSRTNRYLDVISSIATISEITADALVGSTITGQSAVIGLSTFGAGVSVIGMPIAIFAGLYELLSIQVDSSKLPFVNAYSYYLSDCAGGRVPNKADYTRGRYYRGLRADGRARFDAGWTAATRSIQDMIRQQGGRNVVIAFLLLRKEHPDPNERKYFIARRIALQYGLTRHMVGWRYDNLLTRTGSGGPTLLGEGASDYESEVLQAQTFIAPEGGLGTDYGSTFQRSINNDEGGESLVEEGAGAFVKEVTSGRTPFIYMDVGRWGENSRNFGIIYGNGSGNGFAAICSYDGQRRQSVQVPSNIPHRQTLSNFLTRTNSTVIGSMIKTLPGINTNGRIYVLLGDLHFPVWRRGGSSLTPQGILLDRDLVDAITGVGARQIVSETRSLIQSLGRHAQIAGSPEAVFNLSEEIIGNRGQWESFYNNSDIFYYGARGQTASDDLGNFLNNLEQYPGEGNSIRLFQLGDMFELWIGLQLHFRHTPWRSREEKVRLNSSTSAATVRSWVDSSIGANPIINRLIQTQNRLNTVWLFGNHDNYLKVVAHPRLRRRQQVFSQHGIHMEHGHRGDQFNRDGDTRGWQFTQVAFLHRRMRQYEAWVVGDRREVFLDLSRAVFRHYRDNENLPALRVFSMAHTHSPHIRILRA